MNAIDILTQDTSSTESGFLNLTKEEGKSSPSLFDTLLKTSVETKQNVDSTSQNTPLNPNDKTTIIIKPENMENVNIEKALSSNSLLDRLLVEAKAEITEGQIGEVKKSETSEGSKFIDNIKNLAKPQEPIVELEENNKVSNQTGSSLLDKLIVEAKSQIQDDSTLTLKQNIVKAEDQTLELEVKQNNSSSLLDKLILDATTEIKEAKNLNIVNPKIETSNLDDIENKVEPKIIEKKELTPTSLLDKLILDAKNKIVEDKNNLLDKNTIKITPTQAELEVKITPEVSTEELKNLLKTEVSAEEKITISSENKSETKTNVNLAIPSDNSSKQNLDVESNEVQIVKTTEKPKSLMDALIQNTMKKQEDFVSKSIDLTTQNNPAKEIASSIYLGSQKNQLNTQLNFNKNEAINLIKDGASIGDIQKSANILELGFEDADVEQKNQMESLGKRDIIRDLNDKKTILDSILNEKNVRSVDVKNLITKSVEASTALLQNTLNIEDDVRITVNSPLSFNIQTRIIGARQEMSNMMSDIARQMYENYKPPVTVFRINLNPGNLGSIAIMMKNERNSELTITMSISSNATLDALLENQNLLRNSLSKSFEENTKFNLDFSSSRDNKEGQKNQQDQQNQNQDEHIDTQTILRIQEENKETEEKLIEYL